ncbi:flagellar motor protein MotB [Nereida sp. MMG025]|uniref:flagellar motor protein MotB n=1 Tax=Nereida sp. MMG025 TaxID=2909981 RepID=UPI001F21968C|nr:flagellar motor protein MotB [Nereida sp. MMG025]MCF6444657.1 chemotaxis protein MotB [Nereida sp. MMG025]
MAAQNQAPVIIKRKKVIAGGGHHGGAWKVAYADFVTAMMAFFMLMWLLNATTEKQRKGLADYFAPTIAVSRVSGGGDGALQGDSVFSEQTMALNGIGGIAFENLQSQSDMTQAQEAETEALETLGDQLMGRSGEVMYSENLSRHIITKVTDEGLVVEIFATQDTPLFQSDGVTPEPVLEQLLAVVAEVFGLVKNAVAIEAHSRSHPIVLNDDPTWNVSLERAQTTRAKLVELSVKDDRIQRITGHGDQEPAVDNPMLMRNDRIEIILLRSDFSK